jgi:hypothetical protein
MSREVIVRYQTPEGVKSFRVDLEDPEVHSVELAPDLRLYFACNRLETPWFEGRPQFRRRPDREKEKSDGKVYAEVPGTGGIEVRAFHPTTWQRTWVHRVISREEAKALDPVFFAVMSKPKRSLKARRPKTPGRPMTLEEARATDWKSPGGPRTLEEARDDLVVDFPRSSKAHSLLGLLIERTRKGKLPCSISARDIRLKCHNKTGKRPEQDVLRTSDEAVKDTILEGRAVLGIYQVPMEIEQIGSSGIIIRLSES